MSKMMPICSPLALKVGEPELPPVTLVVLRKQAGTSASFAST
jgi:hypothetical protein